MGADVAKSCSSQLSTAHNLSAPYSHTVIPVCEIIQVDTVDVGGEGTFGRVPVSFQAPLEAVTVEVVTTVIARPTGEWKRRCRPIAAGISGHR